MKLNRFIDCDYNNSFLEKWYGYKYVITNRQLARFGAIVSYIFLLLLMSWFFIGLCSFVSAADATKWNICAAVNVTGGECDDFWTNLTGTIASNYTQEIATLNNKIDILQSALSSNSTAVNSRFDSQYNLIANLSQSILANATNYTIVNTTNQSITGFVTITDFNDFRNNFSFQFVRKDEQIYTTPTNNTSTSYQWIFGIIIVVVLAVIFLIVFKGGNKSAVYQAPGANTIDRDFMKVIKHMAKNVNRGQQSGQVQGPPEQEEQRSEG